MMPSEYLTRAQASIQPPSSITVSSMMNYNEIPLDVIEDQRLPLPKLSEKESEKLPLRSSFNKSPLNALQHISLARSAENSTFGPISEVKTGQDFKKKAKNSSMPLLTPNLLANLNSLLHVSAGGNNFKHENNQSDGQESNLMKESTKKISDRQNLEESIVRLFAFGRLQPGEMTTDMTLVKNILGSKAGLFLFDNYQTQILPKGLQQLCLQLSQENFNDSRPDSEHLIHRLSQTWHVFFNFILPTIECILYRLQNKCNLTIRQISLRAFRDEVVLKLNLEESILDNIHRKRPIPSQLRHMLLILNAVMDTFPPQKNKIRLEKLTALLINPFHGYMGLYVDHETEPSFLSSEPIMYAGRKSIDIGIRRISRPLTVQPKQIETLNELFLSVIRRHGQKNNF